MIIFAQASGVFISFNYNDFQSCNLCLNACQSASSHEETLPLVEGYTLTRHLGLAGCKM